MWHFLNQEGFTLVVPGLEDEASIQALIESGVEANNRFLAGSTGKPYGGRLTGTFIYSHPPDYVGRPTMHWDQNDWLGMLRELKELGIDTVIYQAAAWLEVRECSYPSQLLKDFTAWNSLEPLCQAVNAEGMTLFLGGLGNLMAFDEKASDEAIRKDTEMQLGIFAELVRMYRGGFHGFYMSPETAFPGQRQPEREQRLNRYFKDICQGVKTILPGVPVLASPATFYTPGLEADIHDFLYNLFQGVPIDYMTPQDSIGTFGNRLENLKHSFEIWKRLSNEIGFHLWVNVESFQRVRIGTNSDFVPADFQRLAVQLENAHQVGEKIVSWEIPYFYSPLAGERGIRLRQEYLASLAAGER